MTPKRFQPRKLLVAALGVASVNYVIIACGSDETNPPTSGNLPAPSQTQTGTTTSPTTTGTPPTSGNLAPPPDSGVDTGTDASSSDAGDAGADG